MPTRANLKPLCLILLLNLFLVALPASAQDETAEPTDEATVEATAETTAESTIEATTEATVEPTEEATAEATAEATSAAEPTVSATATPDAEAEPQTVGGLSTLVLLIGLGAVLAVGGLALMRERGGKPEDKV